MEKVCLLEQIGRFSLSEVSFSRKARKYENWNNHKRYFESYAMYSFQLVGAIGDNILRDMTYFSR